MASVPGDAAATDLALERAWRAGSEAAFGDLFRRHYGRAVALAQRILIDRATAEDVAQAAFVRIYEAARGRPGIEPLAPKDGRFDALVLTVVRNLSLNEVRRRGRRHCPRTTLEGAPEPAGAERPCEAAARLEEEGRVRDAVAALEGEERAVLALRRDGRSYTEIAEALGLHPDAVRRRMSKALDFVRHALTRRASPLRTDHRAGA
jgi:RNA polymerase sigma-70 factor (ECF subfamily)